MKQTKEYKAYLVSKEWFEIKIDIIQNRGSKCEMCLKKKPARFLQLHHVTYQRLFNEKPEDLKLLCPTCHQLVHGIIKPKKKKPVQKPAKKQKGPYKLNKRDAALQARYNNLRKNSNSKN